MSGVQIKGVHSMSGVQIKASSLHVRGEGVHYNYQRCVCLQGKGEYTMEYHHYQPTLPQYQQEMVQQYQEERLKKAKAK